MRYETQGTGKNKTQRLVIYYKFVGYLDIDPTQCYPNYTADIREGVAIEYVSCEPSDSMKELFPEGYGVVDDDSFEEAETEQAETCSGHDNKKWMQRKSVASTRFGKPTARGYNALCFTGVVHFLRGSS